MKSRLELVLIKNKNNFNKVVDFNNTSEKLLPLNFTASNTALTTDLVASTEKLGTYINDLLLLAQAKYGIGGYAEDRVLYKRSTHFDGKQNRTIHLGVDIWGAANTNIYVPIGGMVHSFAFNNHFGDYGATIILQHQLDTIVFYTLYGHVSVKDLVPLQVGKYISRGEVLAHFGEPSENGDWPPHLHFQIIEDMHLKQGDYPGVCTIAEKEFYLSNCPDANYILNML
jgi:murein DD-endopeptidase MepM/ murein hydrolase activator NlpD